MGRRALLPLPSAQDAALQIAVDQLLTRYCPPLKEGHCATGANPDVEGCDGTGGAGRVPRGEVRHFLVEFVDAVFQVTGRIFGHTSLRQLLQRHAPAVRPSSPVMQSAIQDVQARYLGPVAHLAATSAIPRFTDVAAVAAPSPAANRRPGLNRSEALQQGAAEELIAWLQLELEQARSAQRRAEGLTNEAVHARETLRQEKVELEHALKAATTIRDEQRSQISELLDTVSKTQEQADASHRQAMMNVDRVRSETREALAQAEKLRQALEQARNDLRNERTRSNALEQKVNSLRVGAAPVVRGDQQA